MKLIILSVFFAKCKHRKSMYKWISYSLVCFLQTARKISTVFLFCEEKSFLLEFRGFFGKKNPPKMKSSGGTGSDCTVQTVVSPCQQEWRGAAPYKNAVDGWALGPLLYSLAMNSPRRRADPGISSKHSRGGPFSLALANLTATVRCTPPRYRDFMPVDTSKT